MTNAQKAIIADLQKRGFGYKKISTLTGIALSAVKSHCQRHPITPEESKCPVCGKELVQLPHKKKKTFCSDKCRLTWWKQHSEVINRKTFTTHICKHCNCSFTSYGNSARTYCSRDCFNAARKRGTV